MISLFQLNTCELGILPLILGTLIPFLLGLLLGWILWAKWKKRFEDLTDEHNTLQKNFDQLTTDRDEWIEKHKQVSSDLSIAESNLTRLRLEAKEVKASRDQMKLDYEGVLAQLAAGTALAAEDKSDVVKSSVATESKTSEADAHRGQEPSVKILSAEDMKAAAVVFGKKITVDDLTLIEGIGPKIARVLHEEGIDTWRALAGLNVISIADLLEKNSMGFHVPGTWPKQASLAADGKWAELLKWQDELDGGK